MRWRLLVLGALGLILAAAVGLSAWRSAELTSQAQQIFAAQNQSDGQSQGLTQQQQEAATRMYQGAYILQLALTPLGTAALLCGLGIPVVLAWRWQLRDEHEPLGQSPAVPAP